MLIKFRTKNFRSFKELIELDLTKGKTRKNEERIAKLKNVDILKFSSVFGANASGKSNLVRALKVMQFIVLTGNVPIDAFNEYYKLDDECKTTSTYFETIISISDKVFSYGFEIYLSTGIIESEWLIELNKNGDGVVREKAIFVKENNNFSYLTNLINHKDMISTRLLVYMDDVKNNQHSLLLNKIKSMINFQVTNEHIKDIIDVFMWFNKSLKVVYPSNTLITPEIINSSIYKLNTILKAFDTGIRELKTIEVSEEDFNKENFNDRIGLISFFPILNTLPFNGGKNKMMIKLNSGLWMVEKAKEGFSYFKIAFMHDDNKSHIFTSSNESDGTMRLFELAEPLATNDCDTTFVIDELDRCMHPSLTIQYIYAFLLRANNKKNNNQLIVTTHESRLLDLEKIRRDEIWFTEKKDNESKLYSLEEFNVRFDYVIDKAYMEGRYGGVPIFDKLYLSDIISNENK